MTTSIKLRTIAWALALLTTSMAGSAQSLTDGLLDFSYAGYHHGEEAPKEASELGYDIYDVTKYGAVPDDGKSDLEALQSVIKAINEKVKWNIANTNAIIYFPAGHFILHDANDDTQKNGKTVSNTLMLEFGHIVIRGAGRDKTFLDMEAPNQPTNPKQMWTSPVMMSI